MLAYAASEMRDRFNGARRLSLGEWRQQQQNEDYEQINSNSGWNRFSVLRSTQLHSVSLDLPQEMTFPAMVDISLFCSFSPHLAKKTNKIGIASNILCTIKFTWVQFDDNVIAGCAVQLGNGRNDHYRTAGEDAKYMRCLVLCDASSYVAPAPGIAQRLVQH